MLTRLSVSTDPEAEAVLLAELLARRSPTWPADARLVIDDYQALAVSHGLRALRRDARARDAAAPAGREPQPSRLGELTPAPLRRAVRDRARGAGDDARGGPRRPRAGQPTRNGARSWSRSAAAGRRCSASPPARAARLCRKTRFSGRPLRLLRRRALSRVRRPSSNAFSARSQPRPSLTRNLLERLGGDVRARARRRRRAQRLLPHDRRRRRDGASPAASHLSRAPPRRAPRSRRSSSTISPRRSSQASAGTTSGN